MSIHVHLRGDDSDGRLAVVELVMAAGVGGPPLHVHRKHGEGFDVLEGEVAFQMGDELVTAGPGALAFAAAGTPHTLANRTDRDARMLVLCAPAGFEEYFDRLAAARPGDGTQVLPDPAYAFAVGPPVGGAREEGV
jgi:mannose-6-phosphate isomerase-like protein (cupin superfamily)